MSNPSETNQGSHATTAGNNALEPDEAIDLQEILKSLHRGIGQILGLALLGMAISAGIYLLASPRVSEVTSTRVVFNFDGLAKGEYPDGSKFDASDVTAPDVVAEALQRSGMDNSSAFQSAIREALSIEGIIPPDVVKEHDRLVALGQQAPRYVPGEYTLSLSLPRRFPLDRIQRERLVNEIVNAYRAKFQRAYVNVPLDFGSAFETLRNSDYFEYEEILSGEIEKITAYLNQELKVDQAVTFRSQTTNLSFSDLLVQTQVFAQVKVDGILGLIRKYGLSRDPSLALIKLDYYYQTLKDQESQAAADQSVVDDLLTKSQERNQDYVLGIKSQMTQPQPTSPVIDQGLIDSLLANDSYSFLVHKALEAGLEVKRIDAAKDQLVERRNALESALKGSTENQAAVLNLVQSSLSTLQGDYNQLIDNIRKTQGDFTRQQYADAISLSDQIVTQGIYRPLAIFGAIGLALGLAIGMGLSLLGIYFGSSKR
jgi:ElaB/YqjD/DUF883 family membrane-anchored ribosome-binding protein